MKKIPTIFERDWNGNKSRVVNIIHPGCEWVLAGEGMATRKIDGTCCLVRGGKLFKRRELRNGEKLPPLFEVTDTDSATGKTTGWVPVACGPDDKWHREAFQNEPHLDDGTYELIGPKIQGNPENVTTHHLVKHGSGLAGAIENAPRTFDALRSWMNGQRIEGLVFHHEDGRMAKIKLRDFGIKRP